MLGRVTSNQFVGGADVPDGLDRHSRDLQSPAIGLRDAVDDGQDPPARRRKQI